MSVESIFLAVHTIKIDASLELHCDKSLLDYENTMLQVMKVEQKLQIESTNQIIESMTKVELNSAAKMFIFLNMCPNSWFKSWSTFYKDLFLTQPADQIILTLNRMMKIETSEDKDGKLRAEKLIKRTSKLLSLKFEKIQTYLPGKGFRNASFEKDYKIPKGLFAIFLYL